MSEEKRLSLKGGTQMSGTDKAQRRISSTQMFAIFILINRLN